jgi:hypothetical protein
MGMSNFGFRGLLKGSLGSLALLAAGCVSSREAAPFEVQSREAAVVRWQVGGRLYLREAVCERSETGAVRVRLGELADAREFLLEPDGVFATRGWTGQAGEAPVGLSLWASFLTIYQNADRLPLGERELHTPAARIAVNRTRAGLQSVSLRSLDTAETLSLVFRRNDSG